MALGDKVINPPELLTSAPSTSQPLPQWIRPLHAEHPPGPTWFWAHFESSQFTPVSLNELFLSYSQNASYSYISMACNFKLPYDYYMVVFWYFEQPGYLFKT
jgi:hypothetical protein